MLQNAYFLAKIGADTAENEQHFAEILPKTGNYPTKAQISAADVLPERRALKAPARHRAGATRRNALGIFAGRCSRSMFLRFYSGAGV